MTKLKSDGKKLVIVGLVASAVAAGVKGRQLLDSTEESLPAVASNPFRLSRTELKSVFSETFKSLGAKHLSTHAAGVAYYSTLALFPMLAAIVAIAALLITPSQLDTLITAIGTYLPEDIAGVISTQLESLVSRRSDNIFAAIIAILIALYGASGASKNLLIASNVVYGLKESRGWLAQQAWGVLWTTAGAFFALLLAMFLTANGTILGHFGMPPLLIDTLLYGRWVIILLCSVLGLSVFYKYGPNRQRVVWQWVNWGAILATIVWFMATLVFFTYVQNFANYNQSYSIFAGVIALMIWMDLSALIVLLGAELNHQLEIVNRKKHS